MALATSGSAGEQGPEGQQRPQGLQSDAGSVGPPATTTVAVKTVSVATEYEDATDNTYYLYLGRGLADVTYNFKDYAFSVRCVSDSP